MISKIINYFRSAVIAENLPSIDFFSEGYYEISKEECENGQIAKETLMQLQKENPNDAQLSLLVCPRTLKVNIKDGYKSEDVEHFIGVFFIPVILNLRDGSLSFNENCKPWIPRAFLLPHLYPSVIVGDMDVYDAVTDYNKKKEIDQRRDWLEYWSYSINVFEKVYFNKIKEKKLLNFEDRFFFCKNDVINTTKHIKDLYNHLLNEKNHNPLIRKFLELEHTKSIEGEYLKADNVSGMLFHNAQMGGNYPLSPSQRESIHCYSLISEGEILAVKGPPGTGKTTLLQTIVANEIVQAALEDKDAPVIIASSTNNQAVTNIIDSFGKIDPILDNNLDSRWVCGVNSFATYFPSGEKLNNISGDKYQISTQKGERFIAEIDNEDNINNSKNKFIHECSQLYDKTFETIESCKKSLIRNLKLLNNSKNSIINELTRFKKEFLNLSFEEMIAKSKREIKECNDILLTKENLQKKILDELDYFKKRVVEWEQYYKQISIILRLLKFIPKVKKIISNKLTFKKETREYSLLEKAYTYKDINELLIEHIETLNKQYSANTALLEKQIQTKKEKEEYIEYLISCIEELCVKLKDPITQFKKEDSQLLRNLILSTDLVRVNEYLDTTYRYYMFWLTVHINECTWIQNENPLSGKQKNATYDDVLVKRFKRLALISPCMVMTFYTLPSVFRAYIDKNQYTYLYNFADLLIVDEAGQVLPEIAAPSFALAKKAVVVGDEDQIPPVWNIEYPLDKSLAVNSNLNDFETLQAFGINTSESNVMKIACKSCKFDKYGKGLFLSEHRRCYTEIINFSNELIYNGHLEPLRKKTYVNLSQYPLIGHYEVECKLSQRQGSSRYNEYEAEKIAEWLNLHEKEITSAYKKTLQELIGIITPFRAQIYKIKKALSKYYGWDGANKFSIGTVHTFQGAERNIIIFSTVYGNTDGCKFMDDNKNLLNVAVSRAKDAFWIFGEYDCLKKEGNSPSAILRRYTKNTIK